MSRHPSRPERVAAATLPRADDARSSTTPQRDTLGTTVPEAASPPAEPYGDLKLPHEHDESAASDAAAGDSNDTRAVTRQGAEDVQAGQQDTDCYNATDPRYRRRDGKTP